MNEINQQLFLVIKYIIRLFLLSKNKRKTLGFYKKITTNEKFQKYILSCIL